MRLWMVRYRNKQGKRCVGFVGAALEKDALIAAVKLYGMDIITIFPRGT